jgi:hypothetical protein
MEAKLGRRKSLRFSMAKNRSKEFTKVHDNVDYALKKWARLRDWVTRK